MKLLENLIKKPVVLQRTIGLSVSRLRDLAVRLEPIWEKTEKERKIRSNRRRKVGGGRSYRLLSIDHKLLTVLLYYKAYFTQEFVGVLVDLDQSNISRLLSKILPLIEEAADPQLKHYLARAQAEYQAKPPKERINNWLEFLQKHPDLRDISTDATEQACYRSQDYETQKKYYSGKKKRHTFKTQISVASTGRILDVSQTYPGSVHDKVVIDQEKTIQKFPNQTLQRHDSGYQGVFASNPHHTILLPFKKPKKQELTPFQKQLNAIHSRHRVVAEHALARTKEFKICQYKYRGKIADYNQMFRNIVALVNFKHSQQPLAA